MTTFREKLIQEHPEKKTLRITAVGCPADYDYEHYENDHFKCPPGVVRCEECWDREIPETNLVVGDSKVEHPDTDISEKKEENKMIYAHIGCTDSIDDINEGPMSEEYNRILKEHLAKNSEPVNSPKILDEQTKPKVICISGKAQHGKDTTAGYLKEYLEEKGKRVLIAHYGDLVKYICTTFFDWDGQKDERGRSLLQEVGTDAVRTKTPDFWVKFIKDVLDHFPDKWDYVIIPDCRFPNEVEYLKEHGYSVKHVRVIRSNFISPLTIEQQKHVSEVALDDVIPDVILFNTFGLEELRYAVRNRGLDK